MAQIERFGPDVVAIGLRNIQRSDYTGHTDNLEYYRELVRVIRRSSPARIVVGGGGFSVIPREIMAYIKPDFGIAGEGEEAFSHLILALESDAENLSNIANLYRLCDGRVELCTGGSSFTSLDTLRRPQRSLVDARYYTDYGIESVQTKRGCPLRCDYCTYPLIEGRTIRQRDPALVVDELFEAIAVHPETNHVFIVDSAFNLPPAH